jgi:hypothetical protein
VLDVPAKMAARARVYGHGRKAGKDDAVSIGLAALEGGGIAQVGPDDVLVSLRLLCDRRGELGALRTRRCAGGTGCWPSWPPEGYAGNYMRRRPRRCWPGCACR